ncbi:MAG: UDP-N-acetylmuramyl-tripeptide synthetase [Streptococcaceae bacterium]|jgi:UDP-N-acetylmuramyl-tripeptide synthetase|nr:UDP-N-acetylmuramyl-tripeptide synthetase [Streptococcaceae bacterium]
MTHTLSYKKILKILKDNDLLIESRIENPEAEITNISYDSSKVTANTLFFVKGVHFKEEYLTQALKAGASAYVAEKKYRNDADYILVKDIRLAISILAPIFFEHPADDLNLIGITGTKGKTTVAYFLKNILDAASGTETGLMGTEETITGISHVASHNTTPEPIDLQNFLDEAREAKLPYFTMEVTSQAYKVDRVRDITFDHGIWLNIAEDHISPAEHPDFEDYISCKLQLMLNSREVLIHRETDHFERVLKTVQSSELKPKIFLYGSEDFKEEVDYYYCNVSKSGALQTFTVKSEKTDYSENFAIRTVGLFNVENATAAVAQAKLLNISDEAIRSGLLETIIPGRMNIMEKDGITFIVDYAHNFMSFTALFKAIRKDYPNNKIISVGGGPGEKAYQRRQEFADVVGKYSDYIYLTAEDPQFESVRDICEEIAGYLPENVKYEIIEDREAAIRKAYADSQSDDVIVLLAKGTEAFQKVRGKWAPYPSDVVIAQELLG